MKTAGAKSLATVKLSDLTTILKPDAKVVVGVTWLNSLKIPATHRLVKTGKK